MRGAATGAPSREPKTSDPGSYGALKNSYISGRNRICVYDNFLGNEVIVTVPNPELCPI